METYVTKKNKKKDGTITETTYRTDLGFTPKRVDEICPEYIEAYCEAHGEIEWLVKEASKKVNQVRKNKKTGEEKTVVVNNPFVNVRAAFVDKFFPTIKIGEVKELTWAEKLAKKYGK
jgi:hypothetical protein